MIFIDKILTWARNNGISALYGSPEQINAMMQDTDFAASDSGTVMYCHLITDSETTDGRDTATVALYFCRLCDFDFNGEALLPVQEELKDTGKQLLIHIEQGNEMTYNGVRWQYGYDDYAENVAWVCLRMTVEELATRCVERMPVVKVNDLCPVICIGDKYYFDVDIRLTGRKAIVGVNGRDLYFNYATKPREIPLRAEDLSFSDTFTQLTDFERHTAGMCDDFIDEETNADAKEWLEQHAGYILFLIKVTITGAPQSVIITDPNTLEINEYEIIWT